MNGRAGAYVKTPSRLHFCLIDMNGELGRIDGSLGVAIDKPNVELTAWLSEEIKVSGKDAGKVESMARHFLSKTNSKQKISIRVEKEIPAHVGLGSETQLSLAVAASIKKLLNLQLSSQELAQIMGRGGTSGIGVEAFNRGGLILDGGHSFGKRKEKQFFLPSNASKASPAPVLARYDFPEDWAFVIATPAVDKGAHGERECEIFKEYCPIPRNEVDMITRIILMKLLPSLLEHDIETFGSGLTQLQNLGFAKATKNLMHPTTSKCIKALLQGGAYGAGQSSFGPIAYGLVKQDQKKESLAQTLAELLEKTGGGEVFFAGPNNLGAEITYS